MSAREALYWALWDNYTQAQKNEFIDAFAHELVEQQRAWLIAYVDELGEVPKHQDDITEMIDLIDPSVAKP